MKIMKTYLIHSRIMKIIFVLLFTTEFQNYENLIIPLQKYENNEIHRIPRQSHENHENLIIPHQNHENHEILKIPTKINKTTKNYLFHTE